MTKLGQTADQTAVGRAPAPPMWFTELFAHRRWIRRTGPFPHVYARDVFVPDFYQRLAEDHARVRRERADAFGPMADDFGGAGLGLSELRDGPLALFVTREWHDLIAGVAGVAASGDLAGSVRCHAPGGSPGLPHHDRIPAWFAGSAPGPEEVRLPDPAVDIESGARAAGIEARETVRAVVVLFYLGNPGWQAGDGGETVLHSNIGGVSRTRAHATTVLAVPPLDNSMVVFECTPRSWHAFAGGNVAERHCVVLWLHRPKDETDARRGAEGVQW